MMRRFVYLYRPAYLRTLAYMLQNSEYKVAYYLKWYWRTTDFSKVMHRKELDATRIAKLVLLGVRSIVVVELLIGVVLALVGFRSHSAVLIGGGLAVILVYPLLVAHLCVIPVYLAGVYVIEPKRRQALAAAEKIFANHSGVKIAVVGSYGKTSMKELLLQVLGSQLKVVASPGNKNVAISHAAFARRLVGDEDIVIIEYGEGAPGDVDKLAQLTHPTHAVITGLAPAHLDQYKTLQAAGEDIFSVAAHIEAGNVYVNADSARARDFIQPDFARYGQVGALGWEAHDVVVDFDGTKFTLSKGKLRLKLHSGLMGRHHIGPMSLVAVLAYEFGMTPEQIETAMAMVQPHEHRMKPYQLAGAWVIDDTYNGNIEGIRAGIELLKELPAKRKIYVTPGLVDQGEETVPVHNELGRLIAEAQPDVVVLMQNSVTGYIHEGLESAGFKGELRIEADPLAFYTGLEHIVAVGDVVMMQNDWPDNYA